MKAKKATLIILAIVINLLLAGAVALAQPPPPPPPPHVNCRWVVCAYPAGLPGERPELPAVQCCPVCVPD